MTQKLRQDSFTRPDKVNFLLFGVVNQTWNRKKECRETHLFRNPDLSKPSLRCRLRLGDHCSEARKTRPTRKKEAVVGNGCTNSLAKPEIGMMSLYSG